MAGDRDAYDSYGEVKGERVRVDPSEVVIRQATDLERQQWKRERRGC